MWLFFGLLWAQEPQNQENNQISVVESKEKSPEIVYRAPVLYPEKALTEGFSGEVVLTIFIDQEGFVQSSIVLDSLREDMDKAAQETIQNYRFSPAYNAQGIAIPSSIQYRFVFSLQAVPSISIDGFVLESGIRKPLQNIEVVAAHSSGEKKYIQTDEEGRFRLRGLREGQWTLMVRGPSLGVKTVSVQVKKDSISEIRIYLVRDQALSAEQDLEIIVEERAETAEVTERFLSADDISYLPGSGGDVVKAIQNLPGIARPPFGLGQLIIRGTAPSNSRYYLDGVMIPDVFHFGGITTVISSNSIDEVAYIPGNYSVRYGRQLAGLVDLRTKKELPTKSFGKVSIDIFQSALFFQQRINDKWAVSVSGRRSYADFVLNPIINNLDLNVNIRAPRYYDAQLGLLYKPSSVETFDLAFLLSNDKFVFAGSNAEENQNSLSYQKYFQKLRVRWVKDTPNDWKRETTLMIGPERVDFDVGTDIDIYQQLLSVQIRHEYSLQPSDTRDWGTRFGVDLFGGEDSALYDIPDIFSQQNQFPFFAPAIYGEYTKNLGNLRIVSGLRTDAMFQKGDIFVGTLDPRLSVHYRINNDLTINGGAGIFSQFPEPEQLDPDAGGNPDLFVERSFQYAIGGTYRFFQELRWESAIFYSDLNQLIRGSGTGIQFGGGPPRVGNDEDSYRNTGSGRVYGFESLFRYEGVNLMALFSATFSRSERINENGEVRLFTFDQPYLFNALFSWLMPKNKRLGARIRYGAGNPYTPVVNSIYNLDTRTFSAINGEQDSARNKAFFSLDIRFDKTFVFDLWKLTAYIDIQNATNHKNIELMSYNFDYSQEVPITGLPFFPAFGFQGEW